MKPVGVLCSDLHLTSTRPGCREDDWTAAQEAMLAKISSVATKNKVPVFVAGDIFHKAKEDPEAVSLALRHMRKNKWYGIPGQHDLPGHNLQRIGESSFWNLVEAGVLEYVEGIVELKDLYLIGHSFGMEPINANELLEQRDKKIVGLAHQMVWESEPFPDAPEKGNVKNVAKQYNGYHALVFGDNHQGFTTSFRKGKGMVTIVNCGVAIRRTRAEIDYQPRCYVLFDDMSVKAVKLPTENDIITEQEVREKGNEKLQAFVETLLKQTEVSLSFTYNLKRLLEELEPEPAVKTLLWSIMEQTEE